jgi:hypothetical protein
MRRPTLLNLQVRVVALTLSLSLFAGPSAVAQEACRLTVRNASGSSIGRMEADGTFFNRSGSRLGTFDGGRVRDRSGANVGRIDRSGTIRDRAGSSIGRIDVDGTLRDRSGSSTGRLSTNGIVRNRSGASVGRFDGYVPSCRHVAVAYLFFFEPLHHR